MKYLLSSFGFHNPFIELELPEHAVYPVTLNGSGGLDLDYTSLLISEGYEIDAAVYNFIVDDGPAFLKPMAASLARLRNEGLLTLVDVSAIVLAHREQLINKTKSICADVSTWLPLVRDQWKELQAGRPAFQSQYGSEQKANLNSQHFTVLNAAFKQSGSTASADVSYFASILSRRPEKLNRQMREDASTIVEPLVAHLLIHELLRSKRNAVILDWDDSRQYYDKLYATRWDDTSDEVKVTKRAKDFLTLTMPTLKADNIEAVVRFMRDRKAITSLRREVIRSIASGGEINLEWWNSYLIEMMDAKLQKDSLMRKVRYGSSVMGLFIPGSTLLADASTEAAMSVAENVIEQKVERHDHYWFYALQRVSGGKS